MRIFGFGQSAETESAVAGQSAVGDRKQIGVAGGQEYFAHKGVQPRRLSKRSCKSPAKWHNLEFVTQEAI